MREERDGGAHVPDLLLDVECQVAMSAAVEAILLTALATSACAMLTTISAIDRSMPALVTGAVDLHSPEISGVRDETKAPVKATPSLLKLLLKK